jgi:hypothetical protein
VHKARMADRKKALDAKRDRSGRQRDGENETDSERRVRQRQEDATAVAAHAQQSATRRRNRRREQQELWVHCVALFDDLARCPEPRLHPLAYTAHLHPMEGSSWLQLRRINPFDNEYEQELTRWRNDLTPICALCDYICGDYETGSNPHPPTGEDAWEDDVDRVAARLFQPPASSRPHPEEWMRDPRLRMLMSLPYAPFPEDPTDLGQSENERRLEQGLPPVPGWEPMVEAGLMDKPAYFDVFDFELPAAQQAAYAAAIERWKERAAK